MFLYILALQEYMVRCDVYVTRYIKAVQNGDKLFNHENNKVNRVLLKKEQQQLTQHRFIYDLFKVILQDCYTLYNNFKNYYENENVNSLSKDGMSDILCMFVDDYESKIFNDRNYWIMKKWIKKWCNTKEVILYHYHQSVPNQRASIKKTHNFHNGHFDATSDKSNKNTICEPSSLCNWFDHDLNTMNKIREKISCGEKISWSCLNNQFDDNIHRINVWTRLVTCANIKKADASYNFDFNY